MEGDGFTMNTRKEFDKQWANLKKDSTPHDYLSRPGMKDIAYAWFWEGWNLSQKKGQDVIIDKIIGFLGRMKS